MVDVSKPLTLFGGGGGGGGDRVIPNTAWEATGAVFEAVLSSTRQHSRLVHISLSRMMRRRSCRTVLSVLMAKPR